MRESTAVTVNDISGVIMLIISCMIILAIIGGVVYFGASECKSLLKKKRNFNRKDAKNAKK